MNKSVLYKTKRDKKEYKAIVGTLLSIYALLGLYISILSEELFAGIIHFLPYIIIVILISKKIIRNKWVCTFICVIGPFIPFLLSDLCTYVGLDIWLSNIFCGIVLSIILIRRIHVGKGMKFYIDNENTPLKWLWFARCIRLPVTVLTSVASLLKILGMNDSGMEIHWLDIVFPLMLIVASIVAFIGLSNFEKYGLGSYTCCLIIPVIYNLSIVMLYMSYGLDISNALAQSTGSIVFLILEGIYFWKRRFLFVSYNAELDELIEDEIIKHKKEKKKNSLNFKCNSTDNKTRLEEIKQLKELLDMGAITQEEYDEKKKSVLEKIY